MAECWGSVPSYVWGCFVFVAPISLDSSNDEPELTRLGRASLFQSSPLLLPELGSIVNMPTEAYMGSLNEYCNLLLGGFNWEDLNPKVHKPIAKRCCAWLQLSRLPCIVCIREDIRLDFSLEGGWWGVWMWAVYSEPFALPQTRSVNSVCVSNVSLCARGRGATTVSRSPPSLGTHQTTGTFSLSLFREHKLMSRLAQLLLRSCNELHVSISSYLVAVFLLLFIKKSVH